MPTAFFVFHIETDFIPIYSSCSFCFFSDDKLFLFLIICITKKYKILFIWLIKVIFILKIIKK